MPPTLENSGTLTATGGGVEDTLDDVSAAGVYTLHVDSVNMVAGDVLELKVYEIVLTGGTRRVVAYGMWADAQPTNDLIKKSVPVDSELTDSGSLRFTLTQSGAGTDKAFPWKVLKHA